MNSILMTIHGKLERTGAEGSVQQIRKVSGNPKPCDLRMSGGGDLIKDRMMAGEDQRRHLKTDHGRMMTEGHFHPVTVL